MLCMILALVDSQEDKEKIQELYDLYQNLMYHTAFHILQHEQNAEDAVFASWEKIICHLEKISEIDCKKTRSFIVIIVERTAIDMFRKLKKNREIPLEYEETPYFAVKDPDLEQVETLSWIHSIPKKYAEVMMMYYVQECSMQEIATLLSIDESTVSRRLKKGRELLQSHFQTGG